MKKNEIRTLIAADGERVDWLANLPTSIGNLKQLQQGIKSEFKESAVERCRQQLKHAADSKKGGAASVQVRRSVLAMRNADIANTGRELLSKGNSDSRVCQILGERKLLSTKQIRTILQEHGVLNKRGK